ncbi:MAG TPA: hypothetical protein VGH77_16100 [Streptosporangiaceae bacterium]|jgi:hypothetical protein
MTEQNQTPDTTEDTEGHRYSRAAEGSDDVEGLDSMDDTEGHGRRGAEDIADEDDDVEGHLRKSR